MRNELNKVLSTGYAKITEIFLLVLGQILIIPLILSSWDANLLGLWFTLIATFQLIQLINLSHQVYLYNRAFIFNRKNKIKINQDIFSAIPISLVISFLVVIFLLISFKFNIFGTLLNMDKIYLDDFNLGIIYLSILYFFTYSYGTFFYGPFSVFGYYAIYAWFKVLRAICSSFFPAICIYFGANFLEAVYALIFSELLTFIIIAIYSKKIFNKLSFKFYKPNLKKGLNILISSSLILINYLIDFSKNMGLRIILAIIFSPLLVSYFVVLRIITNFIKFSMDSLRDPLHPKLMNSFQAKNKKNTLLIIEFYWLVSIFLLCPMVVLIQIIMPYFFDVWTLDKLEFQPRLFSLLITSTLFYSVYLPFDMILKGLNENKKILYGSITSAIIFLFLILILFKYYSLVSVGFAILISEIFLLTLYSYYIRNLFLNKKIIFNYKLLILTILFIINTCFITIFITYTGYTHKLFAYFLFSQVFLIFNAKKICSSELIEIFKYYLKNVFARKKKNYEKT